MKKVFFSVANLLIGHDNIFSLGDFSRIKGKGDIDIDLEDDGNEHVIITEVESIGNQFFCIYFKEGNTKPRPSEVFNTKGKSMEANPKKEHQAEMYTQTFVLIQPQSQRVFLSDYRKKKKVKEWLEKELEQDVSIRDVIDEDNFINSLEELHTLHFSQERDQDSYKNINLDNDLEVLGNEVPVGKVEVKATFKSRSLTNKAKKALGQLLRNKKSEKITIAGRTQEGFERTFNTRQIVDKIEVEVEKKENGLYGKKDMFLSLIRSIKDHEKNQ